MTSIYFYDIFIKLRKFNIVSKSGDHMLMHEESPGSIGQGCWITSSEGDLKDSATERYRLKFTLGKGGKAR